MSRAWMQSSFEVLREARSVVVTPPADEPIDVAAAMRHCGQTNPAVQPMIESLIVAAREKVEGDTGRLLVSQTHDVYLDSLPYGGEILLPHGRTQSVTSVKAYDALDVETTVDPSTYQVDTASEPGRIVLRSGQSWPVGLRAANAVVIRAVFGYGDEEAVPQALKQAMLFLVGAMYEHREQVIVSQFAGQFIAVPFGYDQLIAPYRLWIA
jgi:uncharacterized phiE125 gp8 family phage protein